MDENGLMWYSAEPCRRGIIRKLRSGTVGGCSNSLPKQGNRSITALSHPVPSRQVRRTTKLMNPMTAKTSYSTVPNRAF